MVQGLGRKSVNMVKQKSTFNENNLERVLMMPLCSRRSRQALPDGSYSQIWRERLSLKMS